MYSTGHNSFFVSPDGKEHYILYHARHTDSSREARKPHAQRFDWDKKEDVWEKVREELAELEVELNRGDEEKSTAEFGDFLFSLINAGRLYHLNPENALEYTNQKFIRRFNYVEEQTLKQGRQLADMTLAEMDLLWQEAKEKLG
jgi:uncharacterized protein YabN with tetrapyrrole methylase and pyrophosphatase domain